MKKGTAICYGLAVCDVLIPGIPRDAFHVETTRIPRFAYSTGGHTYVPGYFVGDAKDTTGAGDNFAAGFIAALMEGKAPAECARFANATAACSIRYVGASGLTGREEVEALMVQ